MKIILFSLGKEHASYVKPGVEDFTNRLARYFPTEWKIVSTTKQASSYGEEMLKKAEARLILNFLLPDDYVVLLDEKGRNISSPEVAHIIQERANASLKRLVFIIGGAYGVSTEIVHRADYIWSFSKLVFPHMLVRLMLAEQLYRACTIQRNEKYHHI